MIVCGAVIVLNSIPQQAELLSQVRKDDYGGMVFVEDNTPQGTVFIICLKKAIEG